MKKSIIIIFVIAQYFVGLKAKADEGMWLPLLVERLNYVDMQKMGCQLTAEEIYSINNTSLKDAIVVLNNGQCSGFMVSDQGLFFTNHHCARSYIQSHTTLEKDYLLNGFWAKEKYDELRNDKLTASFLIRMEDVTNKILPYVNESMTEEKRIAIIDSISIAIVKSATIGTSYTAKVLPFFQGNEYYLIVNEIFKDVRLVGTPPDAIGEFGTQSDNWKWPRHVSDFTLLRIYTGPDGKPADYSKKNIPLKSKKYLPLSTKGVKKGDFTMSLGYPFKTDRFITSYGVKVATDNFNPYFVDIRKNLLATMKKEMDADPEINIKYTAKYYTIDNYYKYYVAQSEQLQKFNIYSKKVAIEEALKNWINSDDSKQLKYANLLTDLEKGYKKIGELTTPMVCYRQAILNPIELFSYANTFNDLLKQLKATPVDQEAVNKLTQSLTYAAKIYFKSYNKETDKKICAEMLTLFAKHVPSEYYPEIWTTTIEKKYKNNISSFVNDLYENSIFANRDKVIEFLTQPDYKKLEKDIAYTSMLSFYDRYAKISDIYKNETYDISKGNRLFTKAILEMNNDKVFYPNANGTMRLTYGKVTDYTSGLSIKYPFYSTLDEMMLKEVNKPNSDLIIPDRLKELYKNKDYGKYASDSTLNLCFITDNDIIGGMSGAPVINGTGEIIGIMFDINWEATSSDLFFDEQYQRSIAVDIRYVLFIIDKYAEASNIMNELTYTE